MSKEYNSQAFTPEEVKKGLHLDLIKYLLDYNQKAEGYFNDIHIDTDGYCVIIEWVTESYKEACSSFEFVGYDEEVLKLFYPRNFYDFVKFDKSFNGKYGDFSGLTPIPTTILEYFLLVLFAGITIVLKPILSKSEMILS